MLPYERMRGRPVHFGAPYLTGQRSSKNDLGRSLCSFHGFAIESMKVACAS